MKAENINKEDFNSYIEGFSKELKSRLERRRETEGRRLEEQISEFEKNVFEKEERNILADWEHVNAVGDTTPAMRSMPKLIRIGDFEMTCGKSEKLPFLLPTSFNALMVDLGKKSLETVNLFQNIGLRLLLTMRTDLVHITDVHENFSYGFSVLRNITNNPRFKFESIVQAQDIRPLLNRLLKRVDQIQIDGYQDIGEYNESNETPHPYELVFFNDFPSGFNEETLKDLKRLIQNGVARNRGVIIFLNYVKPQEEIRGFDLTDFKNLCANITHTEDTSVKLFNWPKEFSLPDLSQNRLDTELPCRGKEYIGAIINFKTKQVTYNLDGWIEELKKNDEVWTGDSIDGITMPIGYLTPNRMFDFSIGRNDNYSCLISGNPGMGKTVMLNNIIVNAAMKYSPEELELYLADFANGAGLGLFRELPHVKAIMLANNREYALRMFKTLNQICKARVEEFRKLGKVIGKQIPKIEDYSKELSIAKRENKDCKKQLLLDTLKEMPRILFIIDEFHVLFTEETGIDSITLEARKVLERGIREWRKAGIYIILATQSINGVRFPDAANNFITYRFALRLTPEDSKLTIRNRAASRLEHQGQTIMNDSPDGAENRNIEFQGAYSRHYYDHVKYLAEHYKTTDAGKAHPHRPFICENTTDSYIVDNTDNLIESLKKEYALKNGFICNVYLGKADKLRESHTSIKYSSEDGSNTLIVGKDYKTLVYTVMLQLLQIKSQSTSNSLFYVANCFNARNPFYGTLSDLSSLSERFITGGVNDVKQFIKNVYDELKQREDSNSNETGRIVLTILDTSSCRDLRASSSDYGPIRSETAERLSYILREGPNSGIHCIIHSGSFRALFNDRETEILRERNVGNFCNTILLRGSDFGENSYIHNMRITAPEQDGRMIIVESDGDDHSYEQCNAYSAIYDEKILNSDGSTFDDSPQLRYIYDTFNKYRNAYEQEL